jgi:Type IV secretory pathway, VirB3-like protein
MRRVNAVFKTMNRPLTILGVERRLFFTALVAGGALFSLLHSLFGGIGLFLASMVLGKVATNHDVEILRVLLNAGKFHRRYDPMKEDSSQICIAGPYEER